jgi:D-alanyl-D-alanine carboxypeptidase
MHRLPKGLGLRRRLFRIALVASAVAVVGCGGEDGPDSGGGRSEETPDIDLRTFRRVTEEFRGTLEAMVEEEGLPGAVAAFILPDGRVGAASSGMADREAELVMSPETRFLAGSVGKTFVAATVLSLVQEGAIELDVAVSQYLGHEPWYPELPNGPAITVRHLLTHSSGLPDHVYDPEFGPALMSQESAAPYLLPRELVGFVLDDEPLFPAGRGWAYSDTGYVLLGLIIEGVTGRGYADVLKTRILDPLELVRTEAQKRAMPRLAAGYLAPDNPFGLPEKILQDGALLLDPWTEYTGGGLISNPQDLVRWAKALYEEEAMDHRQPGDQLLRLGCGHPGHRTRVDLRTFRLVPGLQYDARVLPGPWAGRGLPDEHRHGRGPGRGPGRIGFGAPEGVGTCRLRAVLP